MKAIPSGSVDAIITDLENLQFLSWFENRCKNDMTQLEWDEIKKNINKYFV